MPPIIIPTSCFDRATGLSGAPGGGNFAGTPSLASQIGVNAGGVNSGRSSGGNPTLSLFEELPDSPELEFGEQSTITHRFKVDYITGTTLMSIYPRGYELTDSRGNKTRVLSTKLNMVDKSGLVAIFTMVCESYSFGNPPDEFIIDTNEINPSIEKHPRYSNLTYLMRYYVRQANVTDDIDLQQVYDNCISNIENNGGTSDQEDAAQELLFKRHKGIDSFYLAGFKISWSKYYWYPQVMNPGGYIEDPFKDGGLPAYCWSVDQTPSGTNIFSQVEQFNGTMFQIAETSAPWGLSWLRQADVQVLQRTWWRVTRTWVGGNLGTWDNEIYNQSLQPYETDEGDGSVPNVPPPNTP